MDHPPTSSPDHSSLLLTPAASRELAVSLGLLAAVVLFAVGGLLLERNGPKATRVLLAFGTYAAVLLGALLAAPRPLHPYAWLPCWMYALAGAGAGLVSGLVRPTTSVRLVLVQTLTAVVLGGVHWVALRWRRRLVPGPAAFHRWR